MSGAPARPLAFDFGLKRIGVAAGNSLTRTATPVTTLAAGRQLPWAAIDALIAEWQPDLLVVGHPGEDAGGTLVTALEAFLRELRERYELDVVTVDESYSSSAAESTLRAGRDKGLYNRRLKRGQVDQLAACLIAEQWMQETLERT